eukprot:Tbor_TRINITY_DN4108_c0_g1::TRINITY_DN4108_c0_g1_i1::g.26599::m.26599/K10751/CHAF1B; chromatin assembly factor 1 subunit B
MATLTRGVLAKTVEIVWHADEEISPGESKGYTRPRKNKSVESLPVQAVACHPTEDILVTIGDDKTMKIWELNRSNAVLFLEDLSGRKSMDKVFTCLASEVLNDLPLCVSWSPIGHIIAIGSADGTIGLYWKSKNKRESTFSESGAKSSPVGCTTTVSSAAELPLYSEKWNRQRLFRGHISEVISLAFSPDSKYVMSGSITGDLLIHDVSALTSLSAYTISEYHQSTKAVAWDPWNRLVASFGCHPALKIASLFQNKGKPGLAKARASQTPHIEYDTTATLKMSYSPDGMLLAVPYGKCSGDCNRCAYIYSRDSNEKAVIRLGMIEAVDNPVLGCAWAPMLFEPLKTDPTNGHVFSIEERLPWGPYQEYRMALALWTEGAVIVYTTDCSGRHAFFTDLHAQPITAVTWSHDARYLFVSSADCYVSMLYFADQIGPAHRTFDFIPKPTVCSFLSTALSNIRATAISIEEKLTRIHENCDNDDDVNIIQPKKKKKRIELKEENKDETDVGCIAVVEVSGVAMEAVTDAAEPIDASQIVAEKDH